MIKRNDKKERRKIRLFTTFGLSADRDYFIENLSMLVSSGMSILSAMDAVSVEIKSIRMEKAISSMREDIEAGSPFWKALEKTKIFPDHTISLIRIGEESGKLAENLKIVGVNQEKDRVFKSKIRGAMLYPVFVMVLVVIVGIGIAWFILPKLATVFEELNLKLPTITRALIEIGIFLGAHGNIAVPVFVIVSFLLIYFIFYFPKTKFIGQGILFMIPGISSLVREVELSRFGHLLGTLLGAGLPVMNAFDSLKRSSQFPRYQKFYTFIKDRLEEGNSFQKSFSLYPKTDKLIPVPVQQMIIAGEQSGNLAATLVKIGQNFESKIDTTTKNLTVILEPVLLVIVWLGVIAVALGVILPIYNLIGGLNP